MDAAYWDELNVAARQSGLAQSKQWLRLLHYRRTLYGALKSQQDNPNFFLSPRGKKDPQAELEATLRAFFEPPPADPEEMQAQCRFPARYSWLKEALRFDPNRLPEQGCPRFETWRDRINAGGLTFVFASSYMNNPASMYGHTFLRLNQKEGNPLNDYSINFAAETPTRSGLVFAVKGLVGAYPGKFTITPYYMKVQQYNNMESRDLWEYTLNIGSAAVDRLVEHLWEMGVADFDYYFLTENCSYQLFPLLEAADPDLSFSNRFHFKTIPSDTVRVLFDRPGFVRKAELRPSTLRLIMARRALLAERELEAAESIARGKDETAFDALKEFTPERQALILDSAYDYFRFRHHFARFQSRETEEYERLILVRRGGLAIKSSGVATLRLPPAVPPEAGHKTGSLGPGYGVMRHNQVFQEFALRGALHDLTENPDGYIPNSQLGMVQLILRRNNETKRAYVERATLVDIISLSPMERWVKYPSWKFFLGLDSAKNTGVRQDHALAARLAGGAGPALPVLPDGRVIMYVMGDVDMGLGGVFDHGYRAGAGGSAGFLLTIAPWWRANAEGGVIRYGIGDVRTATQYGLIQTFSFSKLFSLRAALRRDGPAREALFSFWWYI